MSFTISVASLESTPENATLSDPRCRVDLVGKHLTGRTLLNNCGTSLSVTQDSLIFSNMLIIPPNPQDNSTANIERVIPIKCQYSRVSDLQLSYLPVVRKILFTETGVGQFQFQIEQFRDANFSDKIADSAYPLRMTSSEPIYIHLSLGEWMLEGKEGYGMEVETCVASPSASMIATHNDSSQELIHESCPANQHVRLIGSESQAEPHSTSAPRHFRFSFKPDVFSGMTNSDGQSPSPELVYIHCRLRLCKAEACVTEKMCPPASGPGQRVRRAISNFGVSRKGGSARHLATGPLFITDPDRAVKPSLASPLVIAMGTVAGVATLLAVVVILAWTRTRHRSEGHDEAPTDQH